jgi:hypothetical protein
MKVTVFVFTLALLIFGCDMGQRSVIPIEPLSAIVQLTDTSGRETTTFHRGENFDINFTLVNTTGKKLTFYRGDSGPDVMFSVFRNDSLIATSIDGYVFLMVVSTGHVEPGQTLRGYWRGPTTPAQNPRVTLNEGLYKLQVSFPKFDQVEVKEVPAIQFAVIE